MMSQCCGCALWRGGSLRAVCVGGSVVAVLRLLVLAKRKLSGVVCWPERGHGVLVTLFGEGGCRESVYWWATSHNWFFGGSLWPEGCYLCHKLLRVPRRCSLCFVSVFLSFPFALGRNMCIYVALFRLVTSLPRGAHDPSFFCLLVRFFLFVSLLAFVDKAVFGIGVLVGATSQHFVGSLGTEHIYREFYILSWWEPHMCMSQPCVLALVIHGRKERPFSRNMFFVTPGTTRYR